MGWYADVPGHTLEENEMVSGSDVFLEEVNKVLGNNNEVSLILSDSNEPGEFLAKLVMKSHNQWGAPAINLYPQYFIAFKLLL